MGRFVAALLAGTVIAAASHLYGDGSGREASFSLLAGFAFGAILQRSRFCFASGFRDLFLRRDGRVLLGVVSALGVGSTGYLAVFTLWVPSIGDYLPLYAHIAPAGWPVLLGGALFGAGMVAGGGCVSSHLFRLGEGSTVAAAGLAGVFGGMVLGGLAWNPIYLAGIATAPVVWLPKEWGYLGAVLAQGGALTALTALLLRLPPAGEVPWPTRAGGAAIGGLATLALLHTSPLSVTAELGRLSRELLPERLHGLDTLRGCAALPAGTGLTTNAIFVLALVGGSACASLAAGEFRLRAARPSAYAWAAGGGLLVGFGATISLGCTVGTLLSGIMAFSLSGWIFAAGLTAGAWAAARLLRRILLSP